MTSPYSSHLSDGEWRQLQHLLVKARNSGQLGEVCIQARIEGEEIVQQLAASNAIFQIGIGEKTVEAPLVLESYHILRGWAQVHDVMCFLQWFFFPH